MAKPIKVGQYNTLSILREVPFGLYLDDGAEGILLPKRFVPPGAAVGQKLKVFVYHDGEGRLIATTQKPFGKVGDFVKLKVVQTTPQGAFLDNGLMKDLFVPRSRQIDNMRPGAAYLVHIYIDEQTGRITATEKFDHLLSNQVLSVKEGDLVTLIAYRPTDLGWEMIVDGRHKGLLYHNEIFMAMEAGKQLEGYVKKIYADGNKLDVALGRPGYTRIEDEA
ncbi:MAG TPA: S1-like domain-containing RNA-binding protein, partial [Phnomibacter sp.]|nr:S1-like domain-containing RNA-binding protein [Phnomibacter sp.]